MNVWLNKSTDDLVICHPQWEPIKIDFDEKFYNDLIPELQLFAKGKKCVHGVLVQCGWMIQNRNNVWFGFPMNISDQFIDLGEL